jgi:tetratricopeptide (TPR) repeat protein
LNIRYLVLLLLVFMSAFSHAQSSKKKKKTGLVGKAYHDITARNNIYFNGNEKMKGIQRGMREAHQDDYTQIIPLYTDRDPEKAKSFGTDLDAIVKKASKIIQKHDPSKWADDAFMILGKSYMLKGDYDNSVKSFQYVLSNYKIKKKKSSSSSSGNKPSSGSSSKSSSASKGSSSKSKKPMTAAQIKAAAAEQEQKEIEAAEVAKEASKTQEEKTGFSEEKYFKEPFKQKMRHKPAFYSAYVWLADNYTFMGKYKESEAVFTVLDSRGKFPFRLSDELEAARANLYLMKGDYSKALESLTLMTTTIKRSKKKNRFHFIMAQIHEREKNYSDAVTNYKKSLKGRPRYDMQFAAMMSIARIASNDQSMPSSEIKKMLTKLAKDIKNKEFLDQVYFYLAELCLRESDKKCAVDNLKKSIEASTSNDRQKAVSHLKLADLYFADEKYREAQENYAAAVALLDNKYPGYAEYKYRSEILAELVKQLDIIYEQDSLQRIASLPEKERNKFIDDIIFQKEKTEKEEKEKAQQVQSTPAEKAKPQEEASGGSKSDWYFYNTSLKSNGYNEFVRIWGNRKLEDNWRRSTKSAPVFDNLAAGSDTTKTSEDGASASISLDREALLKNFPISKEAREKSDELLINALYEAATIYKSKLNNTAKAIESFEELLVRYPDNKYKPQVCYNLYLLYKETGNTARADYYKNLLLDKYPDSPFAKVILDPDYLSKQTKKNKKVEDYYKTTFGYYQSGAYDTVILMVSAVDSLYKENSLRPKFALLNAFALGKTQDLKTYKEALSSIVDKYPGDEVKVKAEEILTLLENSDTKEVRIQSNVADFDYMPNDAHYFMITFSKKDIKTTELSNIIAQYNDVNRSLEDLKVNSLILKEDITMVVVKSFRNLAMAKDYAGAIVAGGNFSSYQQGDLTFSIISENNFNIIIKHREIESYLLFYEARYTK